MATAELETHRDLNIPGLLKRRVDVWLPNAYHENSAQHFPVLYVQDGQMVFDQFHNQGGGWKLHEAISKLAEKSLIAPPIVVAIPSTVNRKFEYLPGKALDYPGGKEAYQLKTEGKVNQDQQNMSEQFINWLVDVVKPAIDQRYRTLPEMENTSLMGSSLGGMISLYLLCEFPNVFSKAACLSTHWPILGEGMVAYLNEELPEAGNHKLTLTMAARVSIGTMPPGKKKLTLCCAKRTIVKGSTLPAGTFRGKITQPRPGQIGCTFR